MNTIEQAQASALEASKGYGLVREGNTLYGLGWTVTLDKPWSTMTAAYETEDGELLTFHVDPEESGQLANQANLTVLVEDMLYAVGQYGDWKGWSLLN